MAVPRNRMSNAAKNSKRSHHAKKPKQVTGCPNCGTPRLSHRLCSSCGQYNGRTLIKSEDKE